MLYPTSNLDQNFGTEKIPGKISVFEENMIMSARQESSKVKNSLKFTQSKITDR